MTKVILLKTESDYQGFRRSRAFHGATITLRWIRTSNQNSPRFGFIVPKKVMGKVTDRNKIKRRLKHLIHRHLNNIAPRDILFFPKAGALKKKYPELEREFTELIKRADLWL